MSDDIGTAISSAVSEATTEVQGGSEKPTSTTEAPAKETTPEPKAEVKPEPKADAKPEAPKEEEFWNPTAEELAAIDKNPELKKVYRSMQRGLTQKTQSLAEQRKALAEKEQIVNWIQRDPESALKAIAAASGVSLSEAKKTAEAKVADSLEDKWSQAVGNEAAAILRPIFEETARQILAQEVAPLRQQTAQLSQMAVQRGVAASVREFGAKMSANGDEWDDDIQNEMAEVSKKIQPGNDTPIEEYLSTLYDTVVTRRLRTKNAKSNLERLRKIRSEAEPTTTVRPSKETNESITAGMSERDAIALAVKQARAEIR